MAKHANQTRAAQTNAAQPETAPVVVQAPQAAPLAVAANQKPALRVDTKIAGRTGAATAALVGDAPAVATADVAALTQCAVGAVRASAKGTMYAAPASALVGLGNVAPSAKAPQHQLAVAAVRAVQAAQGVAATHAVCLHAAQRAYVQMGGTDLSVWLGKTRLYTNGGKCALVGGAPQAPLVAYNPAPAQA